MSKSAQTALLVLAVALVAGVSKALKLTPLLFENPQSVFDGQNKHYVNLSTGNLSLRASDLRVSVAGWDISRVTFNRIYDSRLAPSPDFGPGWRLAETEELFIGEDAVTYVDGSGARYRFRADGDRYIARPPTPRHAKSRMRFVSDGRMAVLNVDDGRGERSGMSTRVFRRSTGDSSRYLLVSLQSRHEKRVHTYFPGQSQPHIDTYPVFRTRYFHYEDDLLHAIAAEGETRVWIHRNENGRVVRVTDGGGRNVYYRYGPDGHLAGMVNADGKTLAYEYGPSGRLSTAFDTRGERCLDVRYDAKGRVVEVHGNEYCRHVRYTFAYGPSATTVGFIPPPGAESSVTDRKRYYRNDAGVTVGWSYPDQGAARRFVLDGDNRAVDVLVGRQSELFEAD